MAAVALATTVELLRFTPQSHRTDALLTTLARSAAPAGVTLVSTQAYHGGADWLVLWGPGAPDRVAPMRQQLEAGGRVLCFDLAYWDRDRKVRVSIDAPHPQAWVMRKDWPASRLTADRIALGNVWRPDGPVVMAGIGDKARVQYGSAVSAWETEMIAACRARGRVVHYRPKRVASVPWDTVPATSGPIERALHHASLVITWHSNVAIDAIRLGIPVICRDGAAAAVCASAFPAVGDPQPLPPDVRDRFLANVAWFQWAPRESLALWAWLRELLA